MHTKNISKMKNGRTAKNIFETIRENTTIISLTLTVITLIIVVIGFFINLNVTTQAIAKAEASNELKDNQEHPTFVTHTELETKLFTINQNLSDLMGYFHLVPKELPNK